jgi:hypothetical protein
VLAFRQRYTGATQTVRHRILYVIDVTAISLWENKIDAEAYNTNAYPEVLKTLARFIEGTPKVQTSDVVTSTFHNIAVHATA